MANQGQQGQIGSSDFISTWLYTVGANANAQAEDNYKKGMETKSATVNILRGGYALDNIIRQGKLGDLVNEIGKESELGDRKPKDKGITFQVGSPAPVKKEEVGDGFTPEEIKQRARTIELPGRYPITKFYRPYSLEWLAQRAERPTPTYKIVDYEVMGFPITDKPLDVGPIPIIKSLEKKPTNPEEVFDYNRTFNSTQAERNTVGPLGIKERTSTQKAVDDLLTASRNSPTPIRQDEEVFSYNRTFNSTKAERDVVGPLGMNKTNNTKSAVGRLAESDRIRLASKWATDYFNPKSKSNLLDRYNNQGVIYGR